MRIPATLENINDDAHRFFSFAISCFVFSIWILHEIFQPQKIEMKQGNTSIWYTFIFVLIDKCVQRKYMIKYNACS